MQRRLAKPALPAALATGGGLVFAGALDRYFRAYDDKTGKILWQMRASNIVNSFPITYAVKGRQYVAVVAGYGRNSLAPEIDSITGSNMVYVFALPESVAKH